MKTVAVEERQRLRELVIRELLPRWIEEEPALKEQVARAIEALPPRRMTYEEFLEWADEDTLAEWVNGEVIVYSPASRRHQEIADFLVNVVGMFVEARKLGKVLSAPFQMKLARSGREPDLIFVAKEHLGRLKETHLDGPADLVVEVVSPESVGRDKGEKFYEYEEAGIPEYWIVEPEREWAEFYVLGDEGRYRLMMEGREGKYQSRVVEGFWLRVEWLWQDPLPEAEKALWEIIGYETAVDRLVQAAGSEEIVRRLAQTIGLENLRRLVNEL